MDGLERLLPRQVRLSWEANVFLPGEHLMLDPQAGAAHPELSGRVLTVRETLLTPSNDRAAGMAPASKARWPEIHAFYRFVECAGRWPHSWFIDPRPIRHIHGAIVGSGQRQPGGDGDDPATGDKYAIVQVAGPTHQRAAEQSPIRLHAPLGRRAQLALKVKDLARVQPILGEFLIALTSETSGTLYAVLWHSKLDVQQTGALCHAERPDHRARRLEPEVLLARSQCRD
jgi:hypothetical protein